MENIFGVYSCLHQSNDRCGVSHELVLVINAAVPARNLHHRESQVHMLAAGSRFSVFPMLPSHESILQLLLSTATLRASWKSGGAELWKKIGNVCPLQTAGRENATVGN